MKEEKVRERKRKRKYNKKRNTPACARIQKEMFFDEILSRKGKAIAVNSSVESRKDGTEWQ